MRIINHFAISAFASAMSEDSEDIVEKGINIYYESGGGFLFQFSFCVVQFRKSARSRESK
jgi:hypothetical protein